jgi:sulfite reductase beta subunit-like hemoprotein
MVRGACPDVAVPMDARDGPLVRVTIPGGIITSEQARVLAAVAERHGNGIIEITNRANVQVRGVTDQPAAARLVVAAELSSGTPQGDRARAILASPTAGVDAEELYDTRPIVRRVVAELELRQAAGGDGSAALEPKFSVVVDGGGAVHVRDRRGTERLVADGFGTAPCPAPIGVVPARQPGHVWVGAAPMLGRTSPEILVALAQLTERFGDGDLRLTPWKGLIIAGVAAARGHDLVAGLERLELTVDPADPALWVIACAGSTGCDHGLADVQGLARGLIDTARQHALGDLPAIHLSGCEKCCASRDPALVTWIATNEGMARKDGVHGAEGGWPCPLS